MRIIIWAFIFTLVGVMAVHGLDISSRYSAWQGIPAKFEIQQSLVDNDSEGHGGMDPFLGTR